MRTLSIQHWPLSVPGITCNTVQMKQTIMLRVAFFLAWVYANSALARLNMVF